MAASWFSRANAMADGARHRHRDPFKPMGWRQPSPDCAREPRFRLILQNEICKVVFGVSLVSDRARTGWRRVNPALSTPYSLSFGRYSQKPTFALLSQRPGMGGKTL